MDPMNHFLPCAAAFHSLDAVGPCHSPSPSTTTYRRPRSTTALHSTTNSRRSFIATLAVASLTAHQLPFDSISNAVETIGKDEKCNDASCLGVWDGLLADCPHDRKLGGGAGCASSQDDTPGIFAEPWDYGETAVSVDEDSYKVQMNKLILTIDQVSSQRGDQVEVQFQQGRYLRVLFIDGVSSEKSVGEFYFTPNDTTVQFRIGSASPRQPPISLGERNIERAERIRKAMRYLKVPVLRNRKRTFFFAESDGLDGFGPGSAALGPPEEMSPGEYVLDEAIQFGLQGTSRGMGGRTRRGSDDVDPKRNKIDAVESFPRMR